MYAGGQKLGLKAGKKIGRWKILTLQHINELI
jgi:hypothetical protein